VIATTSELSAVSEHHHDGPSDGQTGRPPPSPPASAADAEDKPSVVGEFCVIRYAHNREPVHGFLARHLRRRLTAHQFSALRTSPPPGGR